MPSRDGTGPDGMGPKFGRCFRNRGGGRRISSSGTIFGTILTAITGVLIKDLTNPNSKIKLLINKFVKSKKIDYNNTQERKVIQPEYEIIEEEKKNGEK